jgi:hypothetical protein
MGPSRRGALIGHGCRRWPSARLFLHPSSRFFAPKSSTGLTHALQIESRRSVLCLPYARVLRKKSRNV